MDLTNNKNKNNDLKQTNIKNDLLKFYDFAVSYTNSHKDNRNLFNFINTLQLFKYFKYIPFLNIKTIKNSKNQEDYFLKYNIEMNCHIKSITIKSYVFGLSLFYFLLVLNNNKNILSLKMATTLIITVSFISCYQLFNYSKVLRIMNITNKNKVEELIKDLNRENLNEKVKF